MPTNLRRDFIEGTFLDNELNPSFREADAVIFGAAFDGTASYKKGTRFGSYAILDASHQIEYQPPFIRERLTDKVKINFAGILDYPETSGLDEKRIEDVSRKAVKDTKDIALEILRAKKLAVLLGGEHSITNGSLEAIAELFNPKDVTILHIDAHLDMRKAFEGLKYSHGSFMFNAIETGFKTVHVGIRDQIGSGDAGGEAEYLDNKNLWGKIFFCATQPQEYYDLFKLKQRENLIFNGTLSEKQTSKIISLIGTKYIHITIDVDGFDPAFFPGTGTPLPHGLTLASGEYLLYRVLKHAKKKGINLLGFDIVETSPLIAANAKSYSAQNTASTQTEMNAALLVYKLLLWNYFERFLK